MACLELDSPQLLSTSPPYGCLSTLEQNSSTLAQFLDLPHPCPSSLSHSIINVPKPPPLPNASYGRITFSRILAGYSYAPYEIKQAWDRLFNEGYEADLRILTDDKDIILAHSSVLGIASSVLRNMLEKARIKGGFRCLKIPGVPSEAARAFVRFLYSSCINQEEMKKFVFHLLVMSHTFSVPSLKTACIKQLEQGSLTTENVVDVLQLARQCDAPRLSLFCVRLIIKDFKTISISEGWKVMKRSNPSLEQELLVSLVETDSRRQEQMKKKEEKMVYVQLYEAMEALLHICIDGCRTIGPCDKMLKDAQATCTYSACKGIESLVRHFRSCRARVPGGCAHCKRMWQLLELHSRMCTEPDICKVPLCSLFDIYESRHFKIKMQQPNKKEELKWKLLVRKVMAAKGTISSISAWRSCVA